MLFKWLFNRLIELVKKLPFQGRFTEWLILWLGALNILFGGDDMFYHYGCPNSKRTKKLQLKKRSIK
jgi:hypothetical protein